MANQTHQLHFLLAPLMSQSHLIPFTDMAKLLAQRGLIVTIIMTPINADRYSKIIELAKNSNLRIQFLTLQFLGKEVGLPEGCENMDSIPSQNLIIPFFEACNKMEGGVESWLKDLDLESRPDCIISDMCLPWTVNLAATFKIPRIVFHVISCFALLCSYYQNTDSDTIVPDVLDNLGISKAKIPEVLNENPGVIAQFQESEKCSEGLVVNSFEELELAFVKVYEKVLERKIWCIGPLFLGNQTSSAGVSTASMDKHECLKWLDSKKESSVLYVCFGSLWRLSPKQLIELASGLEASNHSFIWILRGGNESEEVEKWVEEEKFEEKVKGRGLIIRGWAPQVSILSHPATGGFLTHCGWNSTLEGVSAGLAMITWPMFAEQFHNAKMINEVLKTGVKINGVEEENHLLVKNEDVKIAIEQLMGDGEEGKDRRRRAKELGKMAKNTVEEGGSSYSNITHLIQYVREHVTPN